MKLSTRRRFYHRNFSRQTENSLLRKNNDSNFFGESSHDSFFHSSLNSQISIHRKCDKCEQEDKKLQRQSDEEKLQKKGTTSSTNTSNPTSSYISSLNGKGQPLSKQQQYFFSSRMNYDFSNVKIHTDKEAAESAKEVNAKAYTVGNNIVFNDSEYNKESTEGKKLMAHELAHVVQQNSSTLQRIPSPAQQVRQASTTEKREFVQDNIHHFDQAAGFYADEHTVVDAALFERVIQSWYVMITNSERMIVNELNNDALLLRSLQASYRAAISALVSKAAVSLHLTVEDIYRQNNGRIPIWAWQTPHHMETGFTMPIPEGHAPDILTGNIELSFSNLAVSILPDGIDNTISTPAATAINFQRGAITWRETNGIVTSLTGPGITTATIQTLYKPGVHGTDTSGYGRGTTQEDIRGGTVDTRSRTLGFHEANHALDYMQYLNTHPFPAFAGTVGMRVSQVQSLAQQWIAAVQQYNSDINQFTIARTHCVGTTIDQFNQLHSTGRARIVLECP